MTHRRDRALKVGALTRVEGEGALHIQVRDGHVHDAQLQIYEPPRFFEAFLRGRRHTEPPDITARICGICPVAYQLTACAAIEDACGVALDEPLHALRRLLYCGEWIESHALHVYLLHAPDFLGCDGAVELARTDRATVERGLALKKAGNAVLDVIGGRAIHPVNVRVGGFYRTPTPDERRRLTEVLRSALDLALQTVEWVAGFDFPDLQHDHPLLAMTTPGSYPIDRGTVATSTGLAFGAEAFDRHVTEQHLRHTTALHATLGGSSYLVGPEARFTLNAASLSPLAREAAQAAGLGDDCRNPFRSIVVRSVEIVYAVEEALRILASYEEPARPFVDVPPRAGTGHAVTEAPRGLLYHRYTLDADGVITDARIVPPTAQSQGAVEHDLRDFVDARLALDDAALEAACEQLIRSYDPCISCATHFLELTVDRR